MSADREHTEAWEIPPAEGELTGDGQRYRLKWYPSRGLTKKATFRVVTADRRALLERLVTIRVQQRGASTAQTEPDAGLDDIPGPLLAIMRAEGYTPAEEGSR